MEAEKLLGSRPDEGMAHHRKGNSAMVAQRDPFGARKTLDTPERSLAYLDLHALEQHGAQLARQPVTVRILLENLLRYCGVAGAGGAALVSEGDVLSLARWQPNGTAGQEFAFMPARVLLQDFTGVPCVVDLAAMRDAMKQLGGDPERINPLVPADLVIDHSVQVDLFGSAMAFGGNVEREYER